MRLNKQLQAILAPLAERLAASTQFEAPLDLGAVFRGPRHRTADVDAEVLR